MHKDPKIPILMFLYIILHAPVSGAGQRIVFTEILKDPLGLESAIPGGKSHEFIEFLNVGSDTLFLRGCFLSDGIQVDSLIPWQKNVAGHENCCFNRNFILPGQFALILDKDYAKAPATTHFPIHDSTVIITVDENSLVGGLTLTKGVLLFRGTKNTIYDSLAAIHDPGVIVELGSKLVHTQSPHISEGHSLIPSTTLGSVQTFIPNPDTLSPGTYEFLENGWLYAYSISDLNPPSQYAHCMVSVSFVGKNKPLSSFWSVSKVKEINPLQKGTLPLQPYPIRLYFDLPKQNTGFIFTIYEADKKATIPIDISTVWIPSSAIKINELCVRGTSSMPEWIELVNVSMMPINLKNWRYGSRDDTDTIITSDYTLAPDNFVVLTKDKVHFSLLYPMDTANLQPDSWYTLNNYRDTLHVFNPIDSSPHETVYYDNNWFEHWNTQSMVRIFLTKSGTERSTWTLAQKPSPGLPNPEVAWKSSDHPTMDMGPIPFTPNGDGDADTLYISITLPTTQKLSLSVYGFSGEKLFDFPEPIQKTSIWTGKLSNGKPAPVGPFFVVGTFHQGANNKMIRKKGILWR